MSHELREALNRLRESGIPVTMRALAQAAGVSRATLYRRYGGRERVQAALGEALGGRADEARIFSAVRQVLGRRGFRGTTLEAVADSAKVGVATLYRRYGDRDGLLRAYSAGLPVRKRASSSDSLACGSWRVSRASSPRSGGSAKSTRPRRSRTTPCSSTASRRR